MNSDDEQDKTKEEILNIPKRNHQQRNPEMIEKIDSLRSDKLSKAQNELI